MSAQIPGDEYDTILDLVADGLTLTDACSKQGRPKLSAFLARCRNDADFGRAYFFARQARAEERQAKFVSVVEKVERRELDPQAGKVVLDSIRYLMAADDSRMGERYRAEITGDGGRPLIPEMPKNQSPLDDLEVARYLAYVLEKESRKAPLLLESSTS
jgi:hypothetical protein